MSYIITSNTPDDISNPIITGINRAFSYNNHIANGITIPPNSQVALESIKINKGGETVIDESNAVFYTYLGNELTRDSNDKLLVDTVSVPIRTQLPTGKYTPQSLCNAYEKSLRNSIFHPNYQLSNINVSGINTSIIRAGTKFEGFSASFVCSVSASNTDDDSNGWIGATMFDVDNPTFQADSNGQIANNSATNDITLIQKDSPLSLTGGEFKFQFNNGDGSGGAVLGTAVGLTRCTRTQIGGQYAGDNDQNDQATSPSYYDSLSGDSPSTTFFDYVIRCVEDPLESEANHVLKLYHAVSNDAGNLYMKEFDYRVNASDENSDTGYFTTDATGSVDPWIAKVFWTISNEQVKVVLEDYEGEQYTLCDGTNTNKLNSMKPVGPTTWSLFPKITIPACNPVSPVAPRFMKMLKWEGVQITDFKYGSLKPYPNNPTYDVELYQDWWAYSINEGRETDCKLVDNREAYNYDEYIGVDYNQKGLNASGTIDSKVVLLVRENDLYDGSSTEFTKGANAADILGFGDNAIIDSTFYTSPVSNLITNIKSSTIPYTLSKSSVFVRLGGLTQVSANMSKSANSKIIYHLPRFDNAGNESGALYFSPPERVYINLNNPDELVINSIDIALVKGNEQLADNITGKTVCCLHIK